MLVLIGYRTIIARYVARRGAGVQRNPKAGGGGSQGPEWWGEGGCTCAKEGTTCPFGVSLPSFIGFCRRRTNVQQLTCKIDLSSSFYYLFFSFVLLELKPLVFKWKVLGKNSEKVPKSVKKCENYETILPFSCCPLVFP